MAETKLLKESILKLRKEGKKIAEIAKLLNCSETNVKYHCYRNNLQVKTAKTSKEKIIEIQFLLKEGKTRKEISKIVGISVSTIGRFKNTLLSEIEEEHNNTKTYMQNKRKLMKEKCVEYMGGKCKICGYNKCNSALEFHHLDPNNKEFQISSRNLK